MKTRSCTISESVPAPSPKAKPQVDEIEKLRDGEGEVSAGIMSLSLLDSQFLGTKGLMVRISIFDII